MKYKRLQKWVMIRVAIYLAILTVIGVGYMLLDMKKKSMVEDKIRILMQTGELNDQLNTLKTKAAEIAEARKLWEQIPSKNKEGNGLRIEKIKTVLDNYGKRYDIKDMDIDLSTPTDLDAPYKNESAVTVTSNVTLKFGSISDENILAFVRAILTDIPGYIKVRSFKMVRQTAITESLLADIRRGLKPVLVNAELSLEWRDLKVTAEEKPKEPDQPKGD